MRLNNGAIICVPNEPVEIVYRSRKYYFEHTAWAGWVPVNKDGSGRLTPVPRAVWDLLQNKVAASAAGKSIKAADAAGGE